LKNTSAQETNKQRRKLVLAGGAQSRKRVRGRDGGTRKKYASNWSRGGNKGKYSHLRDNRGGQRKRGEERLN